MKITVGVDTYRSTEKRFCLAYPSDFPLSYADIKLQKYNFILNTFSALSYTA